jgi:hypothetical protein
LSDELERLRDQFPDFALSAELGRVAGATLLAAGIAG